MSIIRTGKVKLLGGKILDLPLDLSGGERLYAVEVKVRSCDETGHSTSAFPVWSATTHIMQAGLEDFGIMKRKDPLAPAKDPLDLLIEFLVELGVKFED
ncbi:hypothetical protein N9878_00460 [bacterium]|nr:hypothetical protein [bacterium]